MVALEICKKVISYGPAVSINFFVKIENKLTKNAELNPTAIPHIIETSVESTISHMPGMIKSDKITSYIRKGRPVKIGSKKEVKRLVVAMQISAIEAFANLTAPKNVIQCTAIKTPIPKNCKSVFCGSRFKSLTASIKKSKLIVVIKTRHQTKTIAERLIKSPNIAVNPQRIIAI